MPDSNFQPSVDHLLKDESGVYIADDNGRGPSKWGVTWATAHVDGWLTSADQIKDLTRESVQGFYLQFFWDAMDLSLLDSLPLASRMLNLGVNVGQATAVHWLQRTINQFTSIKEDGVLGPNTAAAANRLGEEKMLNGIKTRAKLYYESLASNDPEKYAKDLEGWLKRLAEPDA